MKPDQLKYAKSHEWVHVAAEGGVSTATVGITKFAVELLTDLVYLELPQVGRQVKAGESIAEVESVKAVSDIYSPVEGEIVAVNSRLANALETLQSDPFGEGWLVKIRVANNAGLANLFDLATYEKHCREE